jgi:hypothetical protein
MNRDGISLRQLLVLLFLGQLAIGVQLVSRGSAALAGAAAWLAPVGALAVLLPVGWLADQLSQGRGLAAGYRRALGRRVGDLVLLLYIVWGLALLAAELGLYARRMTSLTAGGRGRWFFLLALGAVLLWLVWGGLEAFARAGEIFYLAMVGVLAVVLAVGALRVEQLNLFPVGRGALAGLPAAALQAGGLLCPALYGAFLPVRPEGEGKAIRRRWTLGLCLVLAGVELVVLGGLGPALTARSEVPLFALARDLSVGGAVQRLEGLLLPLWVVSDLALAGVLLFALKELAAALWGVRSPWLPALLLALALGGGGLALDQGELLEGLYTWGLPLGSLLLCVLLPGLAVLWERVTRRKKSSENRKEPVDKG